jgi:hypothetical protein
MTLAFVVFGLLAVVRCSLFVGEGARHAVCPQRPRCAGPSGFLAVLAFGGVSLKLAFGSDSREP